MKHLDIVAAVEVAEGARDPARDSHLAACGRCRRLVADLRDTLTILQGVGQEEGRLPPGLERWARAYAQVAGQPGTGARALAFLAGGAHGLAAVRNGLEHSQAMLYGDHEVQVDLRVEASGENGVCIHGQVVLVGEQEAGAWQLSVVEPSGVSRATTSDADGEFWLEGLSASSGWTLVAERDGRRFLVPRFGSEDGGSAER